MKNVAVALGVLFSLVGCTATTPGSDTLHFKVADLFPMNHRDHFVFAWHRVTEGTRGPDGLQVEHMTATDREDIYEVVISEDGEPAGRLRLLRDDTQLALLSEDDLATGLRRTYDPPLPQLTAPLQTGESSTSSVALVTEIDSNLPLATIDVSQTLKLSPVRSIESHFGRFDDGVIIEARRVLHTPEGDIEMLSATVLVPGIGEVRSEGTTLVGLAREQGKAGIRSVLRRELACAIIAGQAVGDCREIESMIRSDSGGSE